MDIRQNPLWLSLWVGRWFHTDVRISIWFPLLLLSACFKLGGPLGLVVVALLAFSILFHEFAHILMARRTGGGGDEIVLWPLGGLAFVTPAATFHSEFWTAAAGPLFHGIVCLACLPAVMSTGRMEDAMSLLTLPAVSLGSQPAESLVLLAFSLNFKLMLLNLLPIYPLDGSQMAYSIAKLSWDRPTARLGTLWVGIILSFLLLVVAGSVTDSPMFIVLTAVLCLFVMYEHMSVQVARQLDDSFLDDEFSGGYSGLSHRDADDEHDQPPRLGPLARWRKQRQEKRQQKELEQRQETERRVDELLEKVHAHGMQSLSDAERQFLTKASSRYRSQG